MSARIMSINAGSSTASVRPSGVSTSTINSEGSAQTGFAPMPSASVKLMGRALCRDNGSADDIAEVVSARELSDKGIPSGSLNFRMQRADRHKFRRNLQKLH